MVYKGVPSKARMAKSGLPSGLCPIFQHSETMNHIFWEHRCVEQCWKFLEDECSRLLQDRISWRPALFGDCHSQVSPVSAVI